MPYTAKKDLLKDKIILVTGAGDGIGKAASKSYAAHGATVILCGKKQASLDSVYDEIEAAGGPRPAVLAIDFETAVPQDYENLAELIDAEFGRLDGLLVNAGWLGHSAAISQYDIENWFKVMQINLNAPFLITRALLPLLNKSQASSIVFTLDEKDSAYWGAYGVSKSGLTSFMKILADELESDNNPIRVNAIKPDKVRTKLYLRAYPGEDPNSLIRADDIMEQYLYLMGADSSDCHGSIISLSSISS
ncbi:MAG: YciK family oxidoreductase [Gammaproteobacteria bacterium]|nr:YciK family oxidoreductase [Gammaproteobacteria bacterium]